MTASSPNMTTASSMKTESGRVSSGATSTVGQPCACRASTYASHWRCARSTSTGCRSMKLTQPLASEAAGRRTRANGGSGRADMGGYLQR